MWRKELTKGIFAGLVFTILMTVGLNALLPSRSTTLAGEHCADLVAQQAASSDVVPGAWDCVGGEFSLEMAEHGVSTAADFASGGPGRSPARSVRYVGHVDNAYIYMIGSSVWQFTVEGDQVVAYR